MILVATSEEIYRQIEWEGGQIEAGIKRYHLSLTRKQQRNDGTVERIAAGLGDTQPGMLIVREMMEGMVPAIHEAQEEAIAGIANSKGGPVTKWYPLIGWLSAEKLALITCRAILSEKEHALSVGCSATSIALLIGAAIKDELEFEKWRAQSKDKAKAEGQKTSFADRLIASVKGNVDRRTFSRWKKKLAEIERDQWSRDMKLHIGSFLLDLAARHGGGWIRIENINTAARTPRRVLLSDEARAAIGDMHSQFELARPYLLPMLCPPQPWKRAA